MSSSPLISVVIPTHNRRDLLRSSLASVQAQTLGNIEILVVDDGSMDNTEGLVREVMGGDGRVVYLRSASAGVAGARNLGLSQAHASWIYFLDDDDLAHPQCLETLYRRARPPAVAGRAWRFVSSSPAVQPLDIVADPGRFRAHPWPPTIPSQVTVRELLAAPRIPMGAALFARHDVLTAGGFSTARRAAEDYDLWLRLAVRDVIFTLDTAVVYCRQHRVQTSRDQRLHSRETRLALESFAATNPQLIAAHGRLRFRRRLAVLWREEAYELFRAGHMTDGLVAALRGLAHWPGEWRLWAYLAAAASRRFPRHLPPADPACRPGDS